MNSFDKLIPLKKQRSVNEQIQTAINLWYVSINELKCLHADTPNGKAPSLIRWRMVYKIGNQIFRHIVHALKVAERAFIQPEFRAGPAWQIYLCH